MSLRREQLEAIAALLTYPRSDYPEAAKHAAACAGSAAPALVAFATEILCKSSSGLQELYTNTFDLQPACSLDLGWHLFGEDYRRGLFLARMRRELRAYGIGESCELPDHLHHALLLLARMEPAQAEEFAAAVVMPALERMLKCLPPDNPFNRLLNGLRGLMTMYFPAAREPILSKAEGAML